MKNLVNSKTWAPGILIFVSLFILSGNIVDALESGAKKAADLNLIVSIKTSGGLCVYGECSDVQKIFKDGSYQDVNGDGQGKNSRLTHDEVLNLINVIEKTDFQAIRNNPFQETCPRAYDGAELIYYFYTSHGVEEIDSCQYKIDENHPLFKELSNISAMSMSRE